MWYGRRINFIGNGFLFEMIKCYIILYIFIEIDKNGVKVCDGVE